MNNETFKTIEQSTMDFLRLTERLEPSFGVNDRVDQAIADAIADASKNMIDEISCCIGPESEPEPEQKSSHGVKVGDWLTIGYDYHDKYIENGKAYLVDQVDSDGYVWIVPDDGSHHQPVSPHYIRTKKARKVPPPS